MLHVERWGPAEATGERGRVALLHGFTQSGAAWAPVAVGLAAAGYEVWAPDLPGHGRSADVRADLWQAADAVAEAVGPAVYVGYSMGGRLLVHLALAHPEVVDALVLVSTTAGIDDDVERDARRAGDEALAERVETEGVESFVRWWLTLPLFATLPAHAAAVEARLGGSAAGLASSLRLAGAGAQQPLWSRLGEVHAPALVVAGALDDAYVARAERLAAGLGGPVDTATLAGRGHACHLEDPGAFTDLLRRWLDEGDRRSGVPDHTTSPTAKSTPKTSAS